MSEITVKIPAVPQGSYKIKIGSGLLAKLWAQIDSDFSRRNKFIITDENIAAAGHLQTLLGKHDVPNFVITPAGETSKNINTVIAIMEAMEQASLGRDTLIICLGGGTVGDIAGFVAAIFKRGVPVIHIPTTTVAQADSAIGGKTGVDSTLSKNAFGVFWHPAAVFIDIAILKTLDDRQYRAGLVESVKHAIIADANYFGFIEKNIDAILARENNTLEKLAIYNCNIKAAIVEADPTEKNQRRMLNYGHTIGHAIESVSGYELLHGEAVAIGIIGAGLIERQLDLADNTRLERVRNVLAKLSMPATLPTNIDKKMLIETISRDKKAVNKWPPFVLTENIGKVHRQNNQWAVEVKQEIVEKVLDLLK